MNYSEEPRELAVLNQLARALTEATNIEDVLPVRDTAEAALAYAKSARLGLTLQNRAAAMRLRAERKAGKILAEMHLKGGDRRSGSSVMNSTLKDLGISHDQSVRWQKEAAVAEEVFLEYERRADEMGAELTASGFLRWAHHLEAGRGGTRRRGAGGNGASPGRAGRDSVGAEASADGGGGDDSKQHCEMECVFGRPATVQEIKEELEEAENDFKVLAKLVTGSRRGLSGQTPGENGRGTQYYLSKIAKSIARIQRKLDVRR